MTPTSPAGSAPGEDALREKIAIWLLALHECTHASDKPENYVAHFTAWFSRGRGEEHMGDCPIAEHKAPATCCRCVCEEYLSRADDFLAGPLATLLASKEAAERENDHLRASLANSGGPCAYCNLPREDWPKCQSGFPGCGRGDDAMLCPHVGAELETADERDAALAATADLQARIAGLVAENARLFEALEPFSVMAGEIERHHPGWDHDEFWFRLGGGNGPGWILKPFRAARKLRLSIKAARAVLSKDTAEGGADVDAE